MKISVVVTLTLAVMLVVGCGGYEEDLEGVSSSEESITWVPGPTLPPYVAQCGNGTCQAFLGETCSTCPKDCGECCGNHQKDPGEECDSSSPNTDDWCPLTCGTCEHLLDGGTCQARCEAFTPCCGNGICEVALGEDSDDCSEECYCGNNIVDSDESCDGDCPTSCPDGFVLSGLGCYVSCSFEGDGDPLPGPGGTPKPGGPNWPE